MNFICICCPVLLEEIAPLLVPVILTGVKAARLEPVVISLYVSFILFDVQAGTFKAVAMLSRRVVMFFYRRADYRLCLSFLLLDLVTDSVHVVIGRRAGRTIVILQHR